MSEARSAGAIVEVEVVMGEAGLKPVHKIAGSDPFIMISEKRALSEDAPAIVHVLCSGIDLDGAAHIMRQMGQMFAEEEGVEAVKGEDGTLIPLIDADHPYTETLRGERLDGDH